MVPQDKEYSGERPGCFKCKKPIQQEDYYELIWKGKTWEMKANYHLSCLIQAIKDGDIARP